MTGTVNKDQRIVVGVDGSGPSKEALRWAVDQGRLTGASVEAVAAWETPTDWYGMMPRTDRPSTVEDAAQRSLDETVDEAVGAHEGVAVSKKVAQGNPANVLLEEARDAQLLVVGNRGRGGFTEALLGSVSQRCAQHAKGPVVVIREEP
jgi:nucleotide-binding universal stress UspA family protein